jgi:hypothetical protein
VSIDHDDDSGLARSETPQSNTPQPAATCVPPMQDLQTARDAVSLKQSRKVELGHDSNLLEGMYQPTKAERRRSTGSMMVSRATECARNPKLCRFERCSEDRKHVAIMEDEALLNRPGSQASLRAPHCSSCVRNTNSLSRPRDAGSIRLNSDDKAARVAERFHKRRTDSQANDTGTKDDKSIHRQYLQRPQTLRCLNPTLVEFVCNVYSEDGTTERPPLFSEDADSYGPVNRAAGTKMMRLSTSKPYSHSMSWKAFNDQAIFSVLSEPRALLSSFTRNGKLLDSQTMWYCMVRLTRATPDLVLHSLWLAAEDLLIAPQDLHSNCPVDSIHRQKSSPLSQTEAGSLIAICFHALVAAVPVVSDSRTLYELSRTRASGQALSLNAGSVKQNHLLSLDYDDIFSSDLALRLARRLFLGIAAGRRYADLRTRRGHVPLQGGRDCLLEPLLAQLDFMNHEACPNLEFTPADRLMHETRVPTLLLDWARAVLMAGWEGQPYFAEDNAFGGAMAFIGTMCKCQGPIESHCPYDS